jgi:integrase/recombinase XerD
MENSVTLKHVQTVRKSNGRVLRYLRIPGKKRAKLPDLPPDHPEFLRTYLALIGNTEPESAPARGTLAGLIMALLQSDRFLSLSPVYRATIRRHCDAIRAKGGKAMAMHLRAEHIKADFQTLAPHAARARLKAWRLICAFGEQSGLTQGNPAEMVKPKKAPKTGGHPPWTVFEIEQFRQHWSVDSVQRRAFELLFWTGARTNDAVALGRGKIGQDGVLSYVQHKTGQPAYVPWTCSLPLFVSEADRAQLMAALEYAPAQMTFLATAQGRGRTAKGLSNLISAAAKDAGIVDRSAHGLRKSRTIALVDGGATESQGMAWTGHLTSDEFVYYSRGRNRRAAVIGTEPAQSTVTVAEAG